MTRIAPTPSGYLHPGNAVNFLLTAWLAQQHRGRLLLRIDDMDAPRVRLPYLEDVFRVVQWLDLPIDGGPSDVADFSRNSSMGLRMPEFRRAIESVRRAGARLYACRCSRRDLAGLATGGCPGGCRTAELPWLPGTTALRIAVEPPCTFDIGGRVVDLSLAMGDFVLWRRDDLPAYQLASVVADRDLGVNAVVRGVDLLASTAAQLYLAPLLGARAFAAADLRHHELVVGSDGSKLSKSAGRQGHSIAGDAALRERIRRMAAAMAPEIGIEPAL